MHCPVEKKTSFHELVHKDSAAVQQQSCLTGFLSTGMQSGLFWCGKVCMHIVLGQTQHGWR